MNAIFYLIRLKKSCCILTGDHMISSKHRNPKHIWPMRHGYYYDIVFY